MKPSALMAAIALLPKDHYVRFQKEPEEDGPEWMLTACVFHKAPEDGWPSRGARFHLPAPHEEPCPPHFKHDDAVILGASASLDDPEGLERMLIGSIVARWGKKRP